MPVPNEGEDEKKYLGRCMGDAEMNSKHPDAKERAAVCYSFWAKAHPSSKEAEYQKKGLPMPLVTLKALPTMEFNVEGRSDVSTITSKAIDAEGDLVLPDGLNFEPFYDNGSPVNYQHSSLQVGRALWIKARGSSLIAKTSYHRAPKEWTAGKPWISDVVFSAVCKGVLPGKSITLLPEEEREPTDEEAKLGAKRVITKGSVVEYSVCRHPVNPEAVVEEIQKALDSLVDPETLLRDAVGNEVAEAIRRAFSELRSAGSSRG